MKNNSSKNNYSSESKYNRQNNKTVSCSAISLKRAGIAYLLALTMLAVSLPYGAKLLRAEEAGEYEVNGVMWKLGLGDAVGFNENTYKTVNKGATDNNWRDGSVTANGEIGFIESCDPKEDVFILNNTKVVTDGTDIYETPVISNILDEQRKGAMARNSFPWINAVNSYAQNTYGTGWGTTWPRKYQPAAQYRIINNDYTSENANLYNRYTNYETGEVGVQWKDNSGNEWNRRSFASREDDVIVTYIEAPEGKELDITIGMDHIVEMRNQGTTNPRPNSDYVVTDDDNGYAFGTVAKYPIQNRKGSRNRQETKFARGGWGSATRIITDGNVDYAADKRDISVPSSFGGGTISGCNDPKFTITGTSSVILVTRVDRIDTGCSNVGDVRTNLYDPMVKDIDEVVAKYSLTNSEESYRKILAPHLKIHGGMFKNVKMDLCFTKEDMEDRKLTNTQLIAKQNANKGSLNRAFLERIYNNGRFGLICASGYGSTRLGAIWNGAWNPDWSGDFTLDANTNLQISGMNTGNMPGASDGYVNFIVRMVEDWDDDATNIYGMEDAIKAPPRVDGTGEAGSFHFLDGYPHIYVNGITDWLILPMFEYWQCFGNRQVPLGKDVDMERNREVLDLTDEDIDRIETSGYMDLEKDVLYPMLKKTMNFWLQYVDERFYTDGSGVEHADDGTTMSDAEADGDSNCKYIFTPGYSPENVPAGNSENSKESLAYNTTMDIAAARDTLFMARTIIDVINPSDKDELLETWAEFEKRIPDYMYAATGELKEWTSPKLGDRHQHRHVSHAYVAWPGYDSQTDENIRIGVIRAMDARSAAYNGQEASESHGPTHKALVEARLKNKTGLQNVLKYLLTNNYQYSTMMTSHNANHSSTYCTDSAFGIMGAINESLLYSNTESDTDSKTGIIEILPTLMDETMEEGSVTGLRARCNTQVDISWSAGYEAAATLVTDEEVNVVKLRCGEPWKAARSGDNDLNIKTDDDGMPYVELTLKKGVPATVEFELTDGADRLVVSTPDDFNGVVKVGETLDLGARYSFLRSDAVSGSLTWKAKDAASLDDTATVPGVVDASGKVTATDAMKGKTYKIYAENNRGVKSNEIVIHIPTGGAERFEMIKSFADDDLCVSIVNDSTSRRAALIWAVYSADGSFAGQEEVDVDLAPNEFRTIKMPAGLHIADYSKSTVFMWDRETLNPLAGVLKVK